MKKLLLIRHAKAEKELSVGDFNRPLKYTGIQDASFMAERLKEQSIIPQLIISSPALRAKTTAEIFADNFSLPEPQLNKLIYEAGQKTIFKIITGFPDEYDFIALVGHNPDISQILYYLTGEAREVHTATVALINFDIDSWEVLSANTGKLVYYSSPME
jgi:phosphohistidine phosphatase